MGLAEEEVLIRDDSGLLLDVGETRVPKSQEWTKKLTRTICLSLGFLVLGLCVAIPGPTLLDLEDQVKATTFEMMIVFASRSFGYLLGALLGGVLFDCFDKQLLLFCTLLVASIATIAIPWSLTLVVMATMFALQGVTMGALDTGGNVFCIQLWGKKNPPFIQTLHFAFGIGAFIAPLLAKPFLSSTALNTTSIVQGNIPVAPFAYGELHNRTPRSQVFAYPDLKHAHYDFLNIPVEKEIAFKHKSNSENMFILSIIGNSPAVISQEFRYPNGRRKRQVEDIENDNRMWISKKQQSKRDLTSTDPDNGTSTSKSNGNGANINNKTVNTTAPEQNKQSPSENQVFISDSNANATNSGITEEKSNENPESEHILSKTTSNMTKVDATTASNSSKVDVNENNAMNRTESSTNMSSEITTLEPPKPATTEEQVHKPSAATDKDRHPGSADGKEIGKHLDTHKNDILVNTESTDDQNSESTKEEIDKEKSNTSVPPSTATITSNNTSGNFTQFSNETSKDNTSVPSIGLPGSSSTVKTNVSNGTVESLNETSIPEVNTTRTSTTTLLTTESTATEKPTTTTEKPTTTTPLPRSTTTASVTTTTTEVKTTTPPTTSTTTKTTVKITTASTTTVKVTAAPTIKKTSTAEPVFKPVTHGETPSKANEISTKPLVNGPATSSKPVTNSSVATSDLNTTLSDDKMTTTEVTKKPESTVGTLFKNAIHAVKNISRIQFAYLITGIALFLIAITFLVLYCRDKRRLTSDRGFDELERFKTGVTCTKVMLVLLLGVFFFCYMGLEVTFGALVTAFAVDYNKWSKDQGAMAAAIFWGSLATGRGLSIFLSRCCGPTAMLVFDLIFMIIGGLVLAIGVQMYDKLLWLGTLILGLGMSSAFPAGISWAEKYFHLTGKSTAVFVVGSAVGQMIIPVVTGYLYENFGAIVLMYASLTLSIINLVIFILMQCVAVNKRTTLTIHERNGFLPLEDEDGEENLEMDDFVHFDKSQARLRRDKRGGSNTEYHTLISDLEDD